jgi:hypothetical protein
VRFYAQFLPLRPPTPCRGVIRLIIGTSPTQNLRVRNVQVCAVRRPNKYAEHATHSRVAAGERIRLLWP